MTILLYDSVGTVPDMSRPQGGSETGLSLLADALGGVLGRPNQIPDIAVDTLILQRYSRPPARLSPKRVLVYAHDLYRQEYDYLKATTWPIVCVGYFQRRSFVAGGFDPRRLHVIRPILGPHVRPITPEIKNSARWIYPTAANKGLAASLLAWNSDPESPKHKGHRLIVTSSGYDDSPKMMALCARYQVRYLEHQSPLWLSIQIAVSEGVWYVNTAPECFPMTVAIAKFHKVNLSHITCQGHSPSDCGVEEAITTDSECLAPYVVGAQWQELINS